MKKIFAFLPLAAMFVTGCMVTEPEGADDIAANAPIFYASIEEQDVTGTKTYVDDQLTMRWTRDDEISIFVGTLSIKGISTTVRRARTADRSHCSPLQGMSTQTH